MSRSAASAPPNTVPGSGPHGSDQRTVYIAGAGIAGMTLALSLARNGVSSVLLEKNTSLQTEGAGLQISPNARKVLDRLGLSPALEETGFCPRAIDIYPFRRKKPLVSLELGDTAHELFGAPYIVIHRADLADALFSACRKHSTIQFHFGVSSFDVQHHARGISLTFDQTDGQVRTERPLALVGADGVHSPTRRKILGGPDAVYSGYVAWRTLIPASMLDSELDLNHTSLLWGPGFHTVLYPHPRRHVINVAMFTREKLDAPQKPKAVAAPSLSAYARKCSRVQAILRAAEGNWQKWPLNAARAPRWHQGRVGLIGDAAHAMLPYQAQGAAMAIEDAGILGPLLARHDNPEQAFARYYALRRDRVKKVVKTSASNGRIYHLEWPFSLARDLVVALQGPQGHFRRLGWIYNYDVAAPEAISNQIGKTT